MQTSFWRTALVLALLSAVGPFAIDMYLPAMPALGTDLGATDAQVRGTLIWYFLAFGLAQMVYGPLADRYGRKPPLLAGLVIFVVGAVICALAPTAQALIAGRVVQGMGAAAVMVVPRAILRDLATGTEAARLMAAIMMVISVSPLVAPLAGAGLLVLSDWRLIFWVLCVAGGLSLAVAALLQPETLAPEHRVAFSGRAFLAGTATLFRSPVYMGLTLVGALGFSTFFIFISAAAFVYTEQFGLTPVQFGLAFAVNALSFFAGSQFSAPWGERFGMASVMRGAAMGFAVATVALWGIVAAGGGTLAVIIVMLALGNACLGLIIPASMVMALDDHGSIAGLASSWGGTLQMVIGGVITLIAGPYLDGTALPMVAAIALCALAALGVSMWVLPRLKVAVA